MLVIYEIKNADVALLLCAC